MRASMSSMRTAIRCVWALRSAMNFPITSPNGTIICGSRIRKLRQAALGPELLLGELPADVRGTSRIIRDGATLWEKPFVSGEANMSHSIANLEHHHFKYAQFRRAGDVHVHFFGTATLSFADGIETQEGDVFEVSANAFTLPVSNPLVYGAQDGIVAVRSL